MSVTHDQMLQELDERPFYRRLGAFDWIWALLVVAGSIYAWWHYHTLMDGYEVAILAGTAVALVAWGWSWKPVRPYTLAVAAVSLFAVWLYGSDIGVRDSNFFLQYLVASQSAIMWMSALYVLATLTYFFATFTRSEFSGKVASAMTWSATVMGTVGLMVRWRESYLVNADFGHIPVSNLYEVFILFAVITALLYLFYERKYQTRALGGFVLLVISAAVAFLLWYSFDRGAHEIEPLVPALQSYWMKIHVPANFVGYGAFALAAMVGVAYLFRNGQERRNPQAAGSSVLPSLELLDDVMYKSIALGFAFFTVATILGALWAAEAWGGYWSWDPKETWALIVWLNYAAWLHMRLTKGWRGTPMAWWAIVGLFITLFAFLGVNMFLSGLHSYGEL
ncbi:c-type cytochrome biogenesis protein CcsB [Thiohalobacter thiocyanaticus]|uniref:C-type cytochrome biogenesis protein CcsB n=1 Tax=Thiohalobacter thiocyanaticus TaxID=585455 RepID=A0A426QJ84_9GAMM|nr:c-type cytochrome biogenesis protein CcsB [Thiohalobacter thiocyanaticus]RRQ21824.1 c-type cytochrome biogenesis protein CcsB [Thiohalobacter thiocyanaticus]